MRACSILNHNDSAPPVDRGVAAMTRYTRYHKKFNSSEISNKSFDGAQQADGQDRTHPKFASRKDGMQDASLRVRKSCLKCRKTGHTMQDCPQDTAGSVYCYNCGENDHSGKTCPLPFSNYAFALCFVCNGKGHLAGACPKNERGVYPNGGGCRFCGSVRHLARNCRPAEAAQNGDEIIISTFATPGENPENDNVHEALQKIQETRGKRSNGDGTEATARKKKSKTVTF